jgi:methylated-DNA-protein-cysteine methyltransferase-like protein
MNDSQKIYQVLHSIPKGRLCSYGEVAKLAGLPGKARWVGKLLSQLPADSKLPWFRVINAQGKISFPPGSESYFCQLNHLIEEGSADHQGKILWRECRWC